MKPEFPDQTKNNNNIEHWPITTQYFDHVIARFCREIEHCSSRLQNLAPEKFGTRLHDRRARNRRQFSGAGVWSVCHWHYYQMRFTKTSLAHLLTVHVTQNHAFETLRTADDWTECWQNAADSGSQETAVDDKHKTALGWMQATSCWSRADTAGEHRPS